MKLWSYVPLFAASTFLAACASVPRDQGLGDISERVSHQLERQTAPSTVDDPRVASMLEGELTAERAVAIAIINNPRLQVALADLGVAQAELIEASTISNPMLELEARFPADPVRPYEITVAQSLVDLLTLPRRRKIGRLGFEAAKSRVAAEVL